MLAEDNGIEPSSLSQWDGFQDRLGAMPSILRSLWRQMLIFWLLQRAAIHHNGKGIQGIRSVANSQRARLPCCRPNALTVVAMVGGFEPPTSWLTVNRSTTELHHLKLTPSASVDLRTCGAVSPIHRWRSQQSYQLSATCALRFHQTLTSQDLQILSEGWGGFSFRSNWMYGII